MEPQPAAHSNSGRARLLDQTTRRARQWFEVKGEPGEQLERR